MHIIIDSLFTNRNKCVSILQLIMSELNQVFIFTKINYFSHIIWERKKWIQSLNFTEQELPRSSLISSFCGQSFSTIRNRCFPATQVLYIQHCQLPQFHFAVFGWRGHKIPFDFLHVLFRLKPYSVRDDLHLDIWRILALLEPNGLVSVILPPLFSQNGFYLMLIRLSSGLDSRTMVWVVGMRLESTGAAVPLSLARYHSHPRCLNCIQSPFSQFSSPGSGSPCVPFI